ncbi:MAG: ADP-ribosylglycohydrolase family protein [Bacilli bacterium]|nr:ADP-ribosylglycohydrolase family protein [Bacilli bacterium]
MLGAIIGDIVGSIYEVEEVKTLKNKEIDYKKRIKILNKRIPLFKKECSYTDDTVLTAAIAKALLSDRDYEKHLKEFGLKEICMGLDKYGRSRFGEGFCHWLQDYYVGESYGNGCAMRISAIANYYDNLDDVIEETRKATYPSHNHEESYKASEAVAICIYFAKNKKSKEFIKNYIETNYGYDLKFNLEDLQKNYKFTSKAKDSIPQAIFCFLESDNFEDTIRKSISIGGDSDTIAAIAGSIAEVYYGIDKDLIKRLEYYLPEYIINIVNDFYKTIGKEEPLKNEVKEFFKQENIYNEKYFDFIRTKIKTLPSECPLDWYGCFPLLKEGILNDIVLLVPEITSERDILVNIHEHTHALELFEELGTVYEDRTDERENKATEMEKIYKKRKSI